MNLPPAMWLTFPKEAQRELIAQLGKLLHRHLHAQRIGGTHESCCCHSANASGPHGDGLCAAVHPQATGGPSGEHATAISTGRAGRSTGMAPSTHRGAG